MDAISMPALVNPDADRVVIDASGHVAARPALLAVCGRGLRPRPANPFAPLRCAKGLGRVGLEPTTLGLKGRCSAT